MDTITQALLGAVCGNVFARHKLGKRAARWGAAFGALPDLDTLSVLLGSWSEMEHHRGFTHALWFGPLVGPVLGWLLWRGFARRRREQPQHPDAYLGADDRRVWWMVLGVVGILSHPLLDLFTVYGTQLLSPLSDQRFAWNGIGIIDPLYTVPLIIGLLWGRGRLRRTMAASAAALGVTTGYLFFGVMLNSTAEDLARDQLLTSGVKVAEVRAYPRVLQIFLRRVTARSVSGDWYIGELSMWRPHTIAWHHVVEAEDPRLVQLRASEHGQLFQWFAMEQTLGHVEQHGSEYLVSLEDMRYGDMADPEHSMWGIRQRYTADGTLLGPAERFRNVGGGDTGKRLRAMFRATFSPPNANE